MLNAEYVALSSVLKEFIGNSNMAHYDCDDCGHPEGIAYGYCRNCTPQEVFDIQDKQRLAYADAKAAWRREIRDKKKVFIDTFVKKRMEE